MEFASCRLECKKGHLFGEWVFESEDFKGTSRTRQKEQMSSPLFPMLAKNPDSSGQH